MTEVNEIAFSIAEGRWGGVVVKASALLLQRFGSSVAWDNC